MTERNAQWGDLLRRANRGEAAAYARFLTEVVPVIRNIARARSPHGADEVEDIVQEVLLALHAKRHTWRESDPVTPWLYAIVRYKTADAARKRRAGGGRQVPIDDLADVLPDDTAGEVTAAGDLTRLLGEIDDRSAGIVRAVGVEGQSAGEVGARLGMSEGAVRVAYHRALQRLRDKAGAVGTGQAKQPRPAKVDERLE
ncbi:sigma-70 family RNA polymerase sigma factor [Pseudooceanicola sp. HF7]|uniref:sigma-70 family RNA polymerase sigma factor n=1 Tax=Pseudooceanicola sp. HF7 TaxID=2721560 RepID=UPI0014304563|nr:sigma-70 family RNA polymerase sigma factor [Pseudooceanicola sp. HF7]NIZ08925.1 sigma-70 family RNA polymerase sigma factor [Pseudooceanicola sp. HF7]